MRKISTGISAITLIAVLACLSLPHSGGPAVTQIAAGKPDFSASGIDPMPVGTAKQVARMKRTKSERKA